MKTKRFERILDNIYYSNNTLQKDKAKKVLIIYDEKVLFIGDTCIKFGMMGLFKSFFPNALIDINWRNSKFSEVYEALLQGNPFVNRMTNQDSSSIDFSYYDVVLIISFDEEHLLNLLDQNYQLLTNRFPWSTAFFSLSGIGLNLTTRKVELCFPEYTELMQFAHQYPHRPQLFISEAERQWGTEWLEAHGVRRGEKLFIISDSCSSPFKLASTETYCELITFLSEIEDTRILLYDENLIGKDFFYSQRLSSKTLSKMIFAKALGLRRDLRLLASPYTKLVLGPCTGLLHCASGIYNELVKNSIHQDNVPQLITYTGTYEGDWNNAQLWWASSPLVQCLLLKKKVENKEIVLLHELSEKEKISKENLLSSQEYTSGLFINYLKNCMSIK